MARPGGDRELSAAVPARSGKGHLRTRAALTLAARVARQRRSRAFRPFGRGLVGIFAFAQCGTFLLLLDLLFLLRLLDAVAFGAFEPIVGYGTAFYGTSL